MFPPWCRIGDDWKMWYKREKSESRPGFIFRICCWYKTRREEKIARSTGGAGVGRWEVSEEVVEIQVGSDGLGSTNPPMRSSRMEDLPKLRDLPGKSSLHSPFIQCLQHVAICTCSSALPVIRTQHIPNAHTGPRTITANTSLTDRCRGRSSSGFTSRR